MPRTSVPVALRDRLGEDGSFALLELLEAEQTDWSEQVLNLSGERFERRLTEEVSGLRVEFRDGLAGLRVEFHQGLAALRQEIATMRVELFKWSFVFWIGQVAAIAALMAFMLRGRP